LKQGVEEGGAAPVDSVLAIIGPAGTDVSGVGAPKAAQASENRLSKRQKLKQKKKLLRLILHLLTE
jgi:pyruvate dehydrogenase E2 component (dihydrolipoamide acetyltransferase)